MLNHFNVNFRNVVKFARKVCRTREFAWDLRLVHARSRSSSLKRREAKPLCDTNSNRKYTLRQHNNSSSSSLAEVYDDFGTFTPTPLVRRSHCRQRHTQRKTYFGFVCPTQTPWLCVPRRYFDSTTPLHPSSRPPWALQISMCIVQRDSSALAASHQQWRNRARDPTFRSPCTVWTLRRRDFIERSIGTLEKDETETLINQSAVPEEKCRFVNKYGCGIQVLALTIKTMLVGDDIDVARLMFLMLLFNFEFHFTLSVWVVFVLSEPFHQFITWLGV